MEEYKTENKDVVQAIREAGQSTADKIRQVHGRYWDSRLDLCKVVLTISTAVLAGTVSFSSSLIGPGKAGLVCPLLIISSWFLLVISICAALVALWYIYQLNTFSVVFFNKTPEIEEAVDSIGKQESPQEFVSEVGKVIVNVTNSVANPMHNYDKYSHCAVATQFISFWFAILVFVIFGVLQAV